jgi:hypothetical protein
MEKLDLIALTSQVGTGCYREIEGKKVYDFKHVIITVNKSNGDKKEYDILREAYNKSSRSMHHIETYTIKEDSFFHNDRHNVRLKWYNTDDKFNTKLKKLERELAKQDYEIRLW